MTFENVALGTFNSVCSVYVCTAQYIQAASRAFLLHNVTTFCANPKPKWPLCGFYARIKGGVAPIVDADWVGRGVLGLIKIEYYS